MFGVIAKDENCLEILCSLFTASAIFIVPLRLLQYMHASFDKDIISVHLRFHFYVWMFM
jgi:hypothetical protein